MNFRRVLGFLLLVLEAALVGFLFVRWTFPALAVLVACVGLPGRLQLPENRRRDRRLAVALFFAVVFVWRVFGVRQAPTAALLQDGLGYAIIEYFLVVQVFQFYVRRPSGLPNAFAFYGVIVCAAAGDVFATGRWQPVTNAAYTCASMGFVALMAGMQVAARRSVPTPRHTRKPVFITVAVLLVALTLGLAMGRTIKRNQIKLDVWFAEIVLGESLYGQVGFPDRARLNSITYLKEDRADDVALRVISERSPGYLRGLAYDEYREGEWTVTPLVRPVARDDRPANGIPADPLLHTYVLGPDSGSETRSMTVWPELASGGLLFTTLASTRLQGPFAVINMDSNRNVGSVTVMPGDHYTLQEDMGRATLSPPLSDVERARLTSLPANLDPAVARLADTLFTGLTSTSEKVDAVIRHFASHYQYRLGAPLPQDTERLAYFLIQRPPAHCEYFATGAAILLRLGNVPARYVTGFLPVERNEFGGYWVARNRDAHAWVEVYDDTRGWFTVEPTVAAGVPSEWEKDSSLEAAQYLDYLKFSLRTAAKTSMPAAFAKLQRWASRVLSLELRTLAILIGATIFAVFLAAAAILNLRLGRTTAVAYPESAQVGELHRLLRRADRTLRRHGVKRSPDETLHRFATRLESEHAHLDVTRPAAAWYRKYAAVRFSPPPSEDRITALRERVPR